MLAPNELAFVTKSSTLCHLWLSEGSYAMSPGCLQKVDGHETFAAFCAARFLLMVRILTGSYFKSINLSLDRIALTKGRGVSA